MENKKSHFSRREVLNLFLGMSGFLVLSDFKWKAPETMHKRKIPSTGELLPVVGVGTWQTFDVGRSEEERAPLREVLKLLVEKGGSVIDSSPMYGNSEEVVGDLLLETGLRSKIFSATKVWTSGKEAGISQMEKSMDLMKSNPMDLMQVHNLVDWQTHLTTLRKWKEEKKIRYYGITHYHSGAFDDLERIMLKEKIDFLQINYSVRSREAENRIFPLAADKGIAVLINQPFASGSLFSLVKNKLLPEWSKELGCESWGQYFLKFILSRLEVTCVIPGTSKPKHLLDNIGAGFGYIPNEKEREKMAEYLRKL